MPRFVQRRTVLFPTLLGCLTLLAVGGALFLLWAFEGETFLSKLDREPAEVLVVEGWIGQDGVAASAEEFARNGYQFIATTSGLTGNPWTKRRWSYAAEAQEQLIRIGIPPSSVILAAPPDTDNHRTYESAQAVLLALEKRGLHPKAVNIFTLGIHARRSRLVFAKVFGKGTIIGVVPWIPIGYNHGPWWHSSTRTLDLIKETGGYLFEALLNSGREFNSPHHDEPASPAP